MFQSTRPCGARRDRHHADVRGQLRFQSTRPCGARPALEQLRGWYLKRFNPRARVGRDLPSKTSSWPQDAVSIHAPVWGATAHMGALSLEGEGFNPRARVGRDARACKARTRGVVSIHAPVWGATPQQRCCATIGVVSIHAPVWGATLSGIGTNTATPVVSIHAPVWGATVGIGVDYSRWRGFQSTRPCGARRRHVGYTAEEWHVSIHAPVWGATRRRRALR